jgi:hypothetical protein
VQLRVGASRMMPIQIQLQVKMGAHIPSGVHKVMKVTQGKLLQARSP